ncbi:MAG: hypothetical protein M3P33_00620 [bacterium]|nr:hypothetical protein [bacterium]
MTREHPALLAMRLQPPVECLTNEQLLANALAEMCLPMLEHHQTVQQGIEISVTELKEVQEILAPYVKLSKSEGTISSLRSLK